MQAPEISVYKAIERLREAQDPFTVVFTSVNLSQNEGGQRTTLENQLVGPKRKNQNEKLMIGLQDFNTRAMRHIYIHSILEIGLATGEYFKLKLV